MHREKLSSCSRVSDTRRLGMTWLRKSKPTRGCKANGIRGIRYKISAQCSPLPGFKVTGTVTVL
jgi:(p)ppGpp synthase/HD superfamily hydrolase